MNISDLSSIIKLAETSPKEAARLIKLLNIDVLKTLGNNKYSIKSDSKIFDATSKQTLQKASYWANVIKESAKEVNISRANIKPALYDQMKELNSN